MALFVSAFVALKRETPEKNPHGRHVIFTRWLVARNRRSGKMNCGGLNRKLSDSSRVRFIAVAILPVIVPNRMSTTRCVTPFAVGELRYQKSRSQFKPRSTLPEVVKKSHVFSAIIACSHRESTFKGNPNGRNYTWFP